MYKSIWFSQQFLLMGLWPSFPYYEWGNRYREGLGCALLGDEAPRLFQDSVGGVCTLLWGVVKSPVGLLVIKRCRRAVFSNSSERPRVLCVWITLSDSATCGLCPSRRLCPWDSPGRNTGVGCRFLLQGSSRLRGWIQVSCSAGRFFTVWATREGFWGLGKVTCRGMGISEKQGPGALISSRFQ